MEYCSDETIHEHMREKPTQTGVGIPPVNVRLEANVCGVAGTL